MLKKIFISFILLYRNTLSILLPDSCRYTPTCSQYAIDAFSTHGILQGCILTAKRIGRCHHWGSSGYDPVPKVLIKRCPMLPLKRARVFKRF